eukprot:COSAG05_NODE_16894_length_336_cov_1.067511_1_plen_61_part_01
MVWFGGPNEEASANTMLILCFSLLEGRCPEAVYVSVKIEILRWESSVSYGLQPYQTHLMAG